jgi:hypothetical protein
VIIDNNDAGFSSSTGWETSRTWRTWYGTDYVWVEKGDDHETAKWTFAVHDDGIYDISAWWTSINHRSPRATYSLYNNSDHLGDVAVDQRLNTGQFNLLASISLQAGNLTVELTGDSSGTVAADAVRLARVEDVANFVPNATIVSPAASVSIPVGTKLNFDGSGFDPDGDYPLTFTWSFGAGSGITDYEGEDPGAVQFNIPGTFMVSLNVADSAGNSDPIPATCTVHVAAMNDQIVVDNVDVAHFSIIGDWPHSTYYPQWYGYDYQYAASGDGSKEAQWHFTIDDGIYGIAAWWTEAGTRAFDAPYSVYNEGVLVETLTVDQRTNGSQFNEFGLCALEQGTLDIFLTDTASGSVVADAVRINKKCMDMPCVSIGQPKKNAFQSSDTIHVSAEVFGANVTKPDVGVKFVMDGSVELIDYEEPFEYDFENVLAGNHVIEAYLMENGEEVFGNSTHDTVSNVAVGDYYVAVGDSITYATGDYDFSDDISSDGRNTGGGYTPILMDRLAIESGYPHYIANEGVPGDESADGPPLVGDVLLPKYPERD